MQRPYFIDPLLPTNTQIRRCPLPREKATKRILIVKLLAYGDVLMATPLLRAIRDAHPNAYITWMVERRYLQSIDANPYIDELVVWEGDYWRDLLPGRWKKWLNIPQRWLGLRWVVQVLKFRRQLRRRDFDILISMHPEQWRLLVPGSGAAVSIGVFESGRGLERAYTSPHDISSLPEHRTDKYLMPLQSLGHSLAVDKQMTLGYTADDLRFVQEYLGHEGIGSGDDFIAIAPVTTWETKCWSLDRYADLAKRLTASCGCKVVWLGSDVERPAIEEAAREVPSSVLAAGDFEFRQMAALIALSRLVISSDSAPMHAAAALGTPYVGLFGPTTPGRYAPLVGHGTILSHQVPCGPCERMTCTNPPDMHMLCMKLITVHEAYQAAMELLAAGDRT